MWTRDVELLMVEIGYALSSEEHPAPDLVRYARDAEESGFQYASLSDHFHPWIDRQGESSSLGVSSAPLRTRRPHCASAPA
jgi:alkanesulfonate monooxygenase SsuD/methylene tetrahydromethanopterin reductase-like flavin-dependent oxidoreductase (luciferase family)